MFENIILKILHLFQFLIIFEKNDINSMDDETHKLGIQVFEKEDLFNLWLNTTNFYFDYKTPLDFIEEGNEEFVKVRLAGLLYGNNA